jgi:SagB-type dehydrogenase family enzyme
MKLELHKFGIQVGCPYVFLYSTSPWLSSSPLHQFWQKDVNLYEISELYHENTKYRRCLEHLNIGVGMFQRPELVEAVCGIFHSYPSVSRIPLPIENMEIKRDIGEVIVKRRSIRYFEDAPITLNELSKLLYFSFGITGNLEFHEEQTGKKMTQYFRAYPSGGALYPVNTYVGALNVKGLEPGIYHYNVKTHDLEVLNGGEKKFNENFLKCFPSPPGILDLTKISAMIVLSAMFYRSKAKYGLRGYRYVLQESGHIAQNLYLVATALGLGAVALAAFYDDEVNEMLGLDGVEESTVYAIALGKPMSMLADTGASVAGTRVVTSKQFRRN